MRKVFKQTLLITLYMAMIGNAGCTTMQSIHGSQDALAQQKIRTGDKVTLHYVDGTSEQIKLTNIGEKDVEGIADDGRTVVADYEQILSMDHKEVEVLKSAGAAVGVVALGAILVGGLAVGAVAAGAAGM